VGLYNDMYVVIILNSHIRRLMFSAYIFFLWDFFPLRRWESERAPEGRPVQSPAPVRSISSVIRLSAVVSEIHPEHGQARRYNPTCLCFSLADVFSRACAGWIWRIQPIPTCRLVVSAECHDPLSCVGGSVFSFPVPRARADYLRVIIRSKNWSTLLCTISNYGCKFDRRGTRFIRDSWANSR